MSLSNWKINGLDLADAEVDNIILTFQNQDDDYAEIRLGKMFDQSIPPMFMPGAQIVLAYGGTVVFRGTVGNHTVLASAVNEAQSIFAYGPWHWLATHPYKYSYPYVNGATETTHSVIDGDSESSVRSILSAAGGVLQVGTVDYDAFAIPKTETYDQTYADAIRSVLRYVPGAMVVFDYANNPPTCHVLSPASASLGQAQISTTGGKCQSLQLTPRHDLVLDGVVIHYEHMRTVKRRTWKWEENQAEYDKTVTENEGLYYAGSDRAGGNAGRVLEKTVVLGGRHEETYLDWSFGGTLPSMGQVITDKHSTHDFMVRNCPGHPANLMQTSYANTRWVKYIVRQLSSDTSSGQWSMYRIGYGQIPLKSFPKEILKSPDYPGGIKICHLDIEWGWQDAENGTGVSRGEQYFYDGASPIQFGTRKIVETSTVEPIPDGVANKILAANSTLLYDGHLTMDVLADPAQFCGLKRLAVIAPPAITTPIQRVVLDIGQEIATLDFGAPAHLGPSDFIALMKA